MSEETKTNEPVKQEGEFSLKGKKIKPKQLTQKEDEKVNKSVYERATYRS